MSTNLFIPTSVSSSPSGRSQHDYPGTVLGGAVETAPSVEKALRAHAYERASEDTNFSNPPFNFGVAGRLTPNVTERAVGDPRILRGYIRRSVTNDATDPTSKYRLYFMFNPSVINRQFVSYLEQQALDPFNTIFGSSNLVAPPGILDFSFEMFFDRQSEVAQDSGHPGVKVDYDYFDRVIRGVEPGVVGDSELQDNGVFLINPRNIKVVFSPLLTLEGRAYSAETVFEKFSHRMVPTRVRIALTMRVQYVGPDTNSFSMFNVDDAGVYEATVPYENSITVKTTINNILDSLSLESDLTSAQTIASTSPPTATAVGVMGSGGSVAGNGNSGFIWPLKTGFVSQEFKGASSHAGMDIAASEGTPIYAVRDGVVAHAHNIGRSGGYGNMVRIQHSPELGTGYAHQPALDVTEGMTVKQGQQIGRVGNTGNSRGAHLHFEVYGGTVQTNFVDPRRYLPPGQPS